MTWVYVQKSGEMLRGGVVHGVGYSGHNAARNDPTKQDVPGVGPIPRGDWLITSLIDGPTPHGPYVLRLQPQPWTETFGRSGFLIHGDSIQHPGSASEGCIIMPRATRERIWTSNDHDLLVIESEDNLGLDPDRKAVVA